MFVRIRCEERDAGFTWSDVEADLFCPFGNEQEIRVDASFGCGDVGVGREDGEVVCE